MAEIKKMAILRLTPEALSALLQLPEGAEIVRAETDDTRGELRLTIEGAGFDIRPGERIMEAPHAIVTDHWAADGSLTRRTVDWRLSAIGKTEAAPKVCDELDERRVRHERRIRLGTLPTADQMAPAVRSVVQSVAADLVRLPVREMAPERQAPAGLARTSCDGERNGRMGWMPGA